MDRMAEIMVTLLGRAARLLPEARRQWGEAIAAEADAVPPGRPRLSWLAGGLWTVAQEAGMVRRLGYTCAGLVGGGLLLWLDWHPGSANPAAPANRATLAVTVVVLLALPWIMRQVAPNRAARIVRTGGYLAVAALLSVLVGLSRFAGSRFDHFEAFNQANWESDMRSGAWVSGILIVATIGGLGAMVLALTSSRMAVAPTILSVGSGAGLATAALLYALMPLGNPLHVSNPWLAAIYGLAMVLVPLGIVAGAGTLAARRDASDDEVRRMRAGAIAGFLAGATAAVLLAVFTIATMLVFPGHVDLLWANPDPNVAHGTAYEIQMTLGDTSIKYEAALLVGPIVGLVLGAIGSTAAGSRRLVGQT